MSQNEYCLIENLRTKLTDAVIQTGSLTDPEVVAISQRLDILIVEAQKSLSNNRKVQWVRRFHLKAV